MKRAPLTIAKLEDKLQTLVNKFVRLRDGKVCISCGTDNRDRQFHGGHFIARNVNPNLRFNLDNIHSQCSRCNRHLSGNLLMYRYNLITKLGIEKVEELEKLSRDYMKENKLESILTLIMVTGYKSPSDDRPTNETEIERYRYLLGNMIVAYRQLSKG